MITVQLQEADYVAAVRLHRRWSTKMWILVLGSSLSYVVGGVLFLIFAPASAAMWGYILFVGPAFVILLQAWMHFIWIPRYVRRRFKEQKSLQRSYAISWNDEKLTVDGEDAHVGTPWSDYLKWRDSEQVFLIYHSRLLFRILPKRTFPDRASIADFSQLLQEKIGPQDVSRK